MTKPDIQALAALARRLADDMELLELPGKPWVPYREGMHDVVVIGAGMCGLAALARLRLGGIDNVVALDAAEEGREGPWITYARMETLRSPKQLAGPALGLPALTFRAWYAAAYGAAGWDALDKIPREIWMEYLIWFRKVLNLPILNEHRMTAIAFEGDLIALDVLSPGGHTRFLCRHLVLATGRAGLGSANVPGFLRGVDRRFWAHSADPIDFTALKGKRIAVIGAGASAMDNAGTALEAGVAGLDMLIRRREMPRINKMTGIGSQGVVHGMHMLPDEWKWRFFDYVAATQTPPPRSSTLRVSRHPNAAFYLNCAIGAVRVEDGQLVVETNLGERRYDFLIAATGFSNDFTGRPELASIKPFIKTWAEGRYSPRMGAPRFGMTEAPDLGPGFEFREKVPGSCPGLGRVHCFNDAAMLTHGKVSGDIPAVSAGADRLVRHITAALFNADVETHFARLQDYAIPELQGDEWVDSAPDLIGDRKKEILL